MVDSIEECSSVLCQFCDRMVGYNEMVTVKVRESEMDNYTVEDCCIECKRHMEEKND